MRKVYRRSTSDFFFFNTDNSNNITGGSASEPPLLSFRSHIDYKWLDEIWHNMKPVDRINALIGHTDNKGHGLLIKAVRHCNYVLIHTLLKNPEFDPNQEDIFGNTHYTTQRS